VDSDEKNWQAGEETYHHDFWKYYEYPCPDCKKNMNGTGKMIFNPYYDNWSIQYYCKHCQETNEIYTPDSNQIAKGLKEEATLLSKLP